jgi:predicted DNA-binding transcriptional regulator YafY
MPSSYSLKQAYSKAWATWTSDGGTRLESVKLRVNRGTAERFREIMFHESQQIKELGNGDIEVSYRLTGANEMIPWLASWGPEIKILEPTWLAEEIVSYLESTLALYSIKQ